MKENIDKGWKLNGFNRRKFFSFNVFVIEFYEVMDSNINGWKEKKFEVIFCLLCKVFYDLDVCK